MSAQQNPLVATLPEYHVDDETRNSSYHTETGIYGVMEPRTFDTPIEQIREMYGDDPDIFGQKNTVIDGQNRRSLHGHTDWSQTIAEACKMVATVPQYNCYNPVCVREAVAQFPTSAFVSVGREGSPVLYVWTDQAQTVGDILDAIEPDEDDDSHFSARGPDELGAIVGAERYPEMTTGEAVSKVGDGPQALIRAWWD